MLTILWNQGFDTSASTDGAPTSRTADNAAWERFIQHRRELDQRDVLELMASITPHLL